MFFVYRLAFTLIQVHGGPSFDSLDLNVLTCAEWRCGEAGFQLALEERETAVRGRPTGPCAYLKVVATGAGALRVASRYETVQTVTGQNGRYLFTSTTWSARERGPLVPVAEVF